MGATGGYLIGMLLASLVLGYLADRKADQKFITSYPALLLGEVIIFGIGLIWLRNSLELSWSATLSAGFTPFIFGEILKIAIVGTSLPLIWRKISATLNK
jgi:biotin transport system substrate-specific component